MVCAENEEVLNEFLKQDPYFKNELYEKIRILNATPARFLDGWCNLEQC